MYFTTADLCDEQGERFASLAMQLTDFGRTRKFTGRIRTLRCLEDNALLKSVVSQKGDGQVLVVDGLGSTKSALVGENVARTAASNGWAGIVINGAVRDSAQLACIPLGIRALASSPRRSAQTGAGEIDINLQFGDVTFRPEAILYADSDGVIVER